MSWEDAVNSDSDGVNDSAFVNSWNSDKMSDSDEDDATAKELARERAEKQKLAVVANTKHKKTFEEIQAEREAKQLLNQFAEAVDISSSKPLTAKEQRQKMLQGLKAAEDADNLLTQELFGGATQNVLRKEKSLVNFEHILHLISTMKLTSIIEYEKLATILSRKIPNGDRKATFIYLQNLFQEILIGTICQETNSLYTELNKQLEVQRRRDQVDKDKKTMPKVDSKEKLSLNDKLNENSKRGMNDVFDLGDLDIINSDGEGSEDDDDGYDFM